MERGRWGSRFGFITAVVGSAVGLGNLVRFPRELAENGGAAYLLVYLALLLLVGLPAMMGEMSLGKMSSLSPIGAFGALGGRRGAAWMLVGWVALLAALFVLFFYTVMTGWAFRFFLDGVTGGWGEAPADRFSQVAFGPAAVVGHALVTAAVVLVVAGGVRRGIERTVVVLMPLLLLVMLGIVVFALFQPGVGAGYAALFRPDLKALTPSGLSSAVGQVFFSLSLGQGALLTYASYMESKQSVTTDGSVAAFTGTGFAVLAGMMVFPVLAFTGMLADPAAQQHLASGDIGTAFMALPSAFAAMGPVAGPLVGSAFFLGLGLAGLSSAISLLEVPTSALVDGLKVPRAKAALLVGLVVYLFGLLAASRRAWFVLYDELAVNVFIVLAMVLTTVFAGWVAPGVAKELDRNLRSRLGTYMVWMMRTVTPALILAVVLYGSLFGDDGSFWSDGAGWLQLGEAFKDAIGR